jgi:hypothetical protein
MRLLKQQRKALSLFVHPQRLAAQELAAFFACSLRQARALGTRRVRQGFLEMANRPKKARSYQLAARYEALIVRSLS